jgi:hypothetical protein
MDFVVGILIFGAGFFLGGVLVSSGATVKINEARRHGWIEGVSDQQAIALLHAHLHATGAEQPEPQKTQATPSRQSRKKFN